MAGIEKMCLDRSNFLVKWKIGTKKIKGETYTLVETKGVFDIKQAIKLAEGKRNKSDVIIYQLVKDKYTEVKKLSKVEKKKKEKSHFQ